MSIVDTQFPAAERARLLDEVRDHLPAFLSEAATQQYDPVGDVRDLLGLEDRDLRRVIAVHLCLSDAVQRFLAAVPNGLRRPVMSTTRPPVVTQALRGPIDWGATIRTRALAGGDPTQFVARPARRVFDVPENRALVWLLRILDAYLRRAATGAAVDEAPDPEQANWARQLRAQRSRLALAWRHPWLADINPERPGAQTLRRLKATRNTFYARDLRAAILAVLRYGEHPTEQDLTDLLCRRYFRPKEDWRLFEVVVALRLARAFAKRSPDRRRARLLVGAGAVPYARYGLADGDEVRLYYQGWPPGAGPSLHADTRGRHQLRAGASRPDLFIARVGQQPDAVVLELKATQSAAYLGAGLSQLLGYLKERGTAWNRQPSGWLVAPSSAAFENAPADGAELWMVTADKAASAAVDRFAPLNPGQ